MAAKNRYLSDEEFFGGPPPAPQATSAAPEEKASPPPASESNRYLNDDEFLSAPGSAPLSTPALEHVPWGEWMAHQTAAGLRSARESLPLAKDVAAAAQSRLGNPLTGEAPTGDFDTAKRHIEEQHEQDVKKAPIASAVGEIGGYFVPGFGLAGRAAKAEAALAAKLAPRIGATGANIVSGGATGAGLGALQGLGTGTGADERLGNAALTGGIGAVGGSAFPTLAGVGKKLLNVGSALTPAEEAAARQGVKLPRYLGAEGETLPRTAEHVGAIPIFGSAINRAGKKALEQTEEALGKIPGVNPNVTRMEAGDTAKEALHNWVSKRSDRIAERLYNEIDRHVDPKITTDLSATRAKAQEIMASLRAAGLPENSEAIKLIDTAVNTPGGLTFSGIKTLRTKLNEKIAQGILPGDLSQGELKQLKTALTEDLKNAAQNAGGARGLAAFNRANTLYQKISDRRKELAKIIGKSADASPETVFTRMLQLSTEKTGNASRLLQARKSMPPAEWNDVTSGVVNYMGRDAEGSFSPYRFLTEYGKMSEDGKRALFGPTGNPVRDAIEDFREISSQFKKAGKHKNWSGTAHTAIGAASILEAFQDPQSSLEYGLPVLPLALILSSPKSSGMLSSYLRAPTRRGYEALMSVVRSEAGHSDKKEPSREERAVGGKVGKPDYPTKRLSRMERAAKRAREALALESKPLMDAPDEHIANALRIAENK